MKRAPRKPKRGQLALPPEICALICEEIGMARKRDLLAICRVSPLFRDQVQRLLYRVIDLSESSPRRLESWCTAVSRRPQLAESIHTLILELDPGIALSSNMAKLARALAKCVNLKELTVRDSTSGRRPYYLSQHPCIQGWVLNTCKFRLTKFDNFFFSNSMLSQFWNVQCDLRVLSTGHLGDSFPFDAEQLPNLIGLEVRDMRALPAARPLERIELHTYPLPTLDHLVPALIPYSPTLDTLDLLHHLTEWDAAQTLSIFSHVALAVPDLLHFGFPERLNEAFNYLREAESPADIPFGALSKFTRLETFFYYSHNTVEFLDHSTGELYDLGIPVDIEAFGRVAMDACPTLRRVVVAYDLHKPASKRVPKPKDPDVVCTLTRGVAGADTHVEHGTRFDLKKTSMFWRP
ncbi:hypothetical protein FB45DRAFT_177852 [Roridomyces roridus]|uniref:F-box domain-containing protein n=1 Tax=Roridomyces roridus TaxID=1738132 RepID=A0AAD7CDZ6_9AGAR|nr:hypothetical protein FB45DRAFT_177852 [Roridomyces roridus]